MVGRFSRDYRELRFKNTIIPLPDLHLVFSLPAARRQNAVAIAARLPSAPTSKLQIASDTVLYIDAVAAVDGDGKRSPPGSPLE